MKKVKNIYTTQGEQVPSAHGGKGSIQVYRPFDIKDFQSNWHFIDFAIIPPGCSIGSHQHGQNEELYFIVKGTGIMTMDDQVFRVQAGDLILNKPGSSHGLENVSGEYIKLFVVECFLQGKMSPL